MLGYTTAQQSFKSGKRYLKSKHPTALKITMLWIGFYAVGVTYDDLAESGV